MAYNDNAADLLAFAQSQQAIIERQVFDPARDMADIVYPQFVPVVGGDPLAQAVTYVSTKAAGKAKILNGNADDVPLADIEDNVDTRPVYSAAIGYSWGEDELQRSMAMGINLTANKAFAARRAAEELVQKIAFDGDAGHGMMGLIEVSNSVATDVSGKITGKWAANGSVTAADIAKDLIALMRGTGRGEEPTANRIVLPADDYTTALTTFFGDSSQTAITLIQTMFPGVQITSRTALESISSKHKYLAYRYDPTSLAFHLPVPLTFRPVRRTAAFRFEVAGKLRVAGLNVKRKEDFAFAAKS